MVAMIFWEKPGCAGITWPSAAAGESSFLESESHS